MPKYKMISAAVALTLASSLASAAIVSTLTFTTPTGTAGSTDTIDLWVTLTLDPTSDPLMFDQTLAKGGLPASLLPTAGWNVGGVFSTPLVDFASYDRVQTSYSVLCTGNLASCPGQSGEYSRKMAEGADSWYVPSLNMQPGESRNFKLFEFTPSDGSATPGEYSLQSVGLLFVAFGKDAVGNELIGISRFAATCWPANDGSCGFTRTVSEVPLPAGIWLFGSALMGLAGARYRRVIGA